MRGVLIVLWAGYYVRLYQWLTGITGSVHCSVVPVLGCRSGGMFELVIVRMELVVMSSGLASDVTLCQSGFHIHVCYLECVEHMRTEGHCFFVYHICSRCLFVRSLLVWPMYALLQVLHVSLYIHCI